MRSVLAFICLATANGFQLGAQFHLFHACVKAENKI